MPASIWRSLQSVIGQAEKRMLQPLGSSAENGMPPPPPVREPMRVTLGNDFITDAKLLAALKQERLMSSAIGLCHVIRPCSAGL